MPLRAGDGARLCLQAAAERPLHGAISGAACPGPLLDRIDLSIEVPAVTAADLILPPPDRRLGRGRGARVAPRASRQARRFAALGLSGISTNAACPAPVIEQIAQPDADGRR